MSLGTGDASERAGKRPVRRAGTRAATALVPTGYGQDREPVHFTPPCMGCRCPLVNTDRRCPRCERPVPWAA